MSKASGKPNTLPPRHGGYRAVQNGQFVTKGNGGQRLPKPPSGKGGGSKRSND